MNEISHRRGLRVLFGLFLCWVLSLPVVSAQLPRENLLPLEIQKVLAKFDNDTIKINILLDSANQVQPYNPVQAITYCFYALKMAREISSEHHIDQSLLKIGKFLFQRGVYEEAMVYYQEYQKRALAADNLLNQLKIRHNIIALKLAVNDKYEEDLYREMKDLLGDYQALWRKEGDSVIIREMIPGLLVNLSHVALLKDAPHEADEFLKTGVELGEQFQIPQQTLQQLYLIDFIVRTKLKEYKDAFERADKLQALCIQRNDLIMLATLEYYLGNAYLEEGNRKAAVQSYQRTFEYAQQLNHNSLLAESANKLYEIYQGEGDLDKALKYNNAAREAKESMKKTGAASRIAQSEMQERLDALENEMIQEQRSRTVRFVIMLILSAVFGLGMVILFLRLRKKYHFSNKEKTAYAMEANKAILERESMSDAMKAKDRQLVAESMYRIQKNELIAEVVQKLLVLNRQYKKEIREELAEAIKGLEHAMEDNTWDDFELRFMQVHPDFYDRLQAQIPNLSSNERRLCAFLKLGLSSKEISTLTGQSTQSIIMARHRLRKKLGLPEYESSLVKFFADF